MKAEHFDIVVLGGGSGGSNLAWDLALSGCRVAVIEDRWVGGSCPNINCLPTKNVIWSAKVAHLVQHSNNFGTIAGPAMVDMKRVRKRKREMVETFIDGTLERYASTRAELILGKGKFTGPKTILVRANDGGSRLLLADHIVINVGTRAMIPDVPGLREAGFLTNIEALELDYVPEHLIVLGGGFVGLEFAQAFRRFGSRVSVVERGPQIAAAEDADLADEVRRIFKNEGIDVLESTRALQVQGRSGIGVSVVVRGPSGKAVLNGTDVLISAGRIPNTSGIGLDHAGVDIDEGGYVKVNDQLETTAAGIWAAGESSAGNPQFTPVSYDDYRILRENVAGGCRGRENRLIPHCLYIDPPLARVGLSETEAKYRRIDVRIARLPMSRISRAYTIGETQGFMKALVSATDNRILGFAMIGPEASEVMSVVNVAMLAEMPYPRLRDAILAHPTMSEGLNTLFSMVPSKAAVLAL
ncbi:MAG TPA: FAD-dependent oxidoreductase [Candidatus Acidoferrum sp.]|nr:FAD-dependent oxidoreductase [Candidatus Acidoferrum sp.]